MTQFTLMNVQNGRRQHGCKSWLVRPWKF